MKYNVGDRVRIKDIDWYNRHAKETEDNWKYFPFSCDMKKYCGQIMTISIVRGCSYSMIEDDYRYAWTDEMIEGLEERNGKTYPYKIGDRVVLKSNNKCATITDLRYNSQGNLSYFIKIDNDRDINISYPTDLLLPYDNMIEGELTMEETKTKFKVGDRVITDTNMKGKIIEVVEEGWYRVDFDDYNGISQPNGVVSEENMTIMTKETKPEPKFEEVFYDTDSEWLKHEILLPEGYIFKDENGNEILTSKIILEKKKKDYPKTYDECVEIIAELTGSDCNPKGCMGYMSVQLTVLQKLLIYRDAYWKIAGDEMELGKPWEPDYNNEKQLKYGLYEILKYSLINPSQFAFPTEEMRDAFYENFKEDIEKCKSYCDYGNQNKI